MAPRKPREKSSSKSTRPSKPERSSKFSKKSKSAEETGTPSGPPEANEETLLRVLSALGDDPYSIALHKSHIELDEKIGDGDGGRGARRVCVNVDGLMCGSDVWLGLLKDSKSGSGEEEMGVEDVEGRLADYERAMEDYLSVPILHSYITFLSNYGSKTGLQEEEIRIKMELIVERAVLDMERSQVVWNVWKEWEVGVLESCSDSYVRSHSSYRY